VKGMPVEWHPILGHGQDRSGICSDIRKEISQVVNESNEALDIIAGYVPVLDAAKFVRISVNPIFINYMTQAIYLFGVKITFHPFKIETVGSQTFEDHMKVLLMFFGSVGEDKYVVQINMHEFPNDIAENCCHQSLEGSRGVTVPLLHDVTDIGSRYHCEGSLPYVSRVYPDLFVCIGKVNL
jgi:hypothetical protein